MAELETICAPVAPTAEFDPLLAESIACRTSALVDEGRLFFPNVPAPGRQRGYRVKLLDEVLRTFYVARHVAAKGIGGGPHLRELTWQARIRFVDLLQKEVRSTLRQVSVQHIGESIPKDPTTWSN